MVCMPPGSAKSTYASVLFPAWLFAQAPNLSIIGASHTADLADSFSRRVMMTVRENSAVLGYGLATESMSGWATTNGGFYKSAGVGGPITGRRADVAIIDDPVKSREDADSERYRDRAWNWFSADLRTRLKPGGKIVVIMCMVGQTQVLMANGNHKRLEDIRIGDKIATYDSGILSSSVVEGWKSQGYDNVFEVRTKSGAKTRANSRHPFLIERNGIRSWVRLRNLRLGDGAVRVTGIDHPILEKGPGKAYFAPGTDANSQRYVKAFVRATIININGLVDIGRLLLEPQIDGPREYGTGTTSTNPIINRFSNSKVDCAQSVKDLQPRMCDHIGVENFALTTTTLRERSEDYFATTATSWLDTEKTNKHCFEGQNTSRFILDPIIDILEVGRDEVFDIQVGRTENFIADGFVSHNTRWHQDDLGGRLIDQQGERWRVLKLPAIAGEDDAMGRAPGEWLWADGDYGYSGELKKVHDEYQASGAMRDWSALFQQEPRPGEGALFKTSMIGVMETEPVGTNIARAWDLAATEQTGTRDPDWTVGVKLLRMQDGRFVVLDVVRVRGGPDEVEQTIVNTAAMDGHAVRIGIAQDPGQAGKQQILYLTRKLTGYRVESSPETGAKETRAAPIASQVNVGNVHVVKARWNASFIDELGAFPSGTKDDQVDALSRAFSMIGLKAPPMNISKTALNYARQPHLAGRSGMTLAHGTQARR